MKVQSRLPAPVALRIFTWIDLPDDIDGRVARCVRGPVVLRPGVNEIDAEFWRDWHEQNRGGLLAAHLAVVAEEEALPLP